jgi:hypothetical protein
MSQTDNNVHCFIYHQAIQNISGLKTSLLRPATVQSKVILLETPCKLHPSTKYIYQFSFVLI